MDILRLFVVYVLAVDADYYRHSIVIDRCSFIVVVVESL